MLEPNLGGLQSHTGGPSLQSGTNIKFTSRQEELLPNAMCRQLTQGILRALWRPSPAFRQVQEELNRLRMGERQKRTFQTCDRLLQVHKLAFDIKLCRLREIQGFVLGELAILAPLLFDPRPLGLQKGFCVSTTQRQRPSHRDRLPGSQLDTDPSTSRSQHQSNRLPLKFPVLCSRRTFR